MNDHPMLEVKDIHVSFGVLKALNGVSFHIEKGEIVAIIGPNGAGKTTIINVISGVYHPKPGHIFFEGKDRTAMRPITLPPSVSPEPFRMWPSSRG